MKYKYDVLLFDLAQNMNDISKVLNSMAKDGWLVCNATCNETQLIYTLEKHE